MMNKVVYIYCSTHCIHFRFAEVRKLSYFSTNANYRVYSVMKIIQVNMHCNGYSRPHRKSSSTG